MKNLYISLFHTDSLERFGEFIVCLQKNLKIFDQVFVLTEGEFKVNHIKIFRSKNIIQLPVKRRPTYKMFFNAINHTSDYSDINIIANSDIYFEELDFDIMTTQCYALTRYDHGTKRFMDRNDSQDAWVFRGHVRFDKMFCSFALGVPGCDNRIAWELKRQQGYFVSNPSLTIKSYHMHRNPKEHNRDVIIQPPHLKIEPTEL